jgi:hypothetical protein
MKASALGRETALLALMLALAPQAAEARRVYGADVPDPSSPVPGEEGHFIVRRPWNRVLRTLRRSYGRVEGVVLRRLDTPPNVKAYHVENTRPGRSWDGMNVYEDIREGTVHVQVLRAE